MRRGQTGNSIVNWILWIAFLAFAIGAVYFLINRFAS